MQDTARTKKCNKCSKDFEIAKEDADFYKEIKIQEPTLCPDCRQQRRLLWRNERVLYKRKCDATGKEILSVYSQEKPFPVYNNDYWYSDKWDAMTYGRDFDFNRPFFEQFGELINSVPQLSRSAVANQNSDYVNQCGWCKNCYLIFEADYDENCMYCNNIYDSRFSMDMLMAVNCELCYECIDCDDSYNLKFSQDCKNCSDSWFLKSCIGCRHCFGCVNMRDKQYYFLNEKCSKDKYEEKLKATKLKSYDDLQKARENFANFVKKYPHKYLQGVQNEDSTGNYLSQTQRCENCFDLNHCQDCRFVFNSRNMKKCYDITVFGSIGGAEYCYDSHEIGGGARNVFFGDQIWNGVHDIFYSKLCIDSSHDLFGCVGLKHKEYCIFNKQYSKEEYEALKKRIIEHMMKANEWGEFLPKEIVPYAYNETIALAWYPLTKEEALSQGYKWEDPDPREYLPQKYIVPADIKEVKDEIIDEILACRDCGKNYKIIEAELNFYRRQNLPIPLKCHDCRHKDRFKLRNPRHLYDRNCQKCGQEIKTTYDPDRPEPVCCEKCFVESLD